ncbi:MAG: methyltransferase family protein [Leptospirillia bacterium]
MSEQLDEGRQEKESFSDWVRYSRLATRTGVGAIVAGVGLATAVKPCAATFGIAALLALTGAVIRFWSAGIISKSQELATSGPYAYVRNPLYSGSFLIAVALLALNGNPYFVVPVAVLAVVLYTRTIRSEEAFLTEHFGEAFIRYRDAVPALIPWKGKVEVEGAETAYSLEQSLFNKEYAGTFGTVGMLILFYVYMNWVPEFFFRATCGSVVAAYLILRAVKTVARERRRAMERAAVAAGPPADIDEVDGDDNDGDDSDRAGA